MSKYIAPGLGISFLIAACIIGSLKYPKNFLWFFETEISFIPDLISGIISMFVLLPLWRNQDFARGLQGYLALFALVPLFYLTAVLANIGLGGSGINLLKLPILWLMGFILFLANLNIKKYAELALIVLLFLASFNIYSASKAMGFNGFLFVFLSLFGSVLVFDPKKIFKEVTDRS